MCIFVGYSVTLQYRCTMLWLQQGTPPHTCLIFFLFCWEHLKSSLLSFLVVVVNHVFCTLHRLSMLIPLAQLYLCRHELSSHCCSLFTPFLGSHKHYSNSLFFEINISGFLLVGLVNKMYLFIWKNCMREGQRDGPYTGSSPGGLQSQHLARPKPEARAWISVS